MGISEELAKLEELHRTGSLTADEFATAKAILFAEKKRESFQEIPKNLSPPQTQLFDSPNTLEEVLEVTVSPPVPPLSNPSVVNRASVLRRTFSILGAIIVFSFSAFMTGLVTILFMWLFGYLAKQLGGGFLGNFGLFAIIISLVAISDRNTTRTFQDSRDRTIHKLLSTATFILLISIGGEGIHRWEKIANSTFGAMKVSHSALAGVGKGKTDQKLTSIEPQFPHSTLGQILLLSPFCLVEAIAFGGGWKAASGFYRVGISLQRNVPYEKQVEEWGQGKPISKLGISLAILTTVPIYFYMSPKVEALRAIEAEAIVVYKKELLYEQMVRKYDEHYKEWKGLLRSNRTISDYANSLGALEEIEYTSPRFRSAFRSHQRAWVDFGALVEKNTSFTGLITHASTDGLSLLNVFLLEFPASKKAIKDTEEELLEVVKQSSKE